MEIARFSKEDFHRFIERLGFDGYLTEDVNLVLRDGRVRFITGLKFEIPFKPSELKNDPMRLINWLKEQGFDFVSVWDEEAGVIGIFII